MTITAKHLRPRQVLETEPVRGVGARGSFAVFVASFLICLARNRNPGVRFSLWAEDGIIFTQQARTGAVWHTLLTTYSGYVLTLPRAVAALASALPLAWTPQVYGVSAMVVAAGVATISFHAARDGMRLGVGESAIVAGNVLLLPGAGSEVFGTLTNVEWYCLAGVVVYVAAWFEGWQTNPYLTAILLFIAATTTPLAGFVLPFFLVRLGQEVLKARKRGATVLAAPRDRVAYGVSEFLRGWNRFDIAVIAGLYGGALATFISHLHSPPSLPVGPANLGRLANYYSVRVVDQAPLGDRLLQPLYFAIGQHASTVLGAVLGGVLLAGALISIRRSWTPLLLIVTSVVLFMVPAVVRGLSSIGQLGMPSSEELDYVLGGRYFGVPCLCLLLAAVLMVFRRRTPPGAGVRGPLLSLSSRNYLLLPGLLLGVVLVFNVPVIQGKFPLQSWERSVASSRRACARNDHVRVVIPIAPGPSWGINISCRQAFRG